ncbi:LPS export ABC transporter permease LptF [Vibrio atypicus]|uniref:LPS export ABC transporter permease LptF n=1 Tax=Vibrio atypicus TaxID=558271 RepID=UPI00135BFBA5|nr:LPS export ABC transporter permease LptF [Vibrio atypicus]
MIIVRYLIRETLKSQLAIFSVLLLVFISQTFIKVLGDATDGDIPARLILSIVGLNIPKMGLLMLPMSLYIGILLTFGRLYSESEITVMNATGMGSKPLIRAAMSLALITTVIAAFNSLYLAPWALEKEAQLTEQVAAENSVDLLKAGQFQRTPDGSSVVFIDEIKDKKLNNVFVAQLSARDSILPSVMFSDSGKVKETKDGRQMIVMQDGTRYEGIPTRLDYMVTEFEQYSGVIGEREVEARKRSWGAIPTLELIDDPDLWAQAELQWRISLFICIPLLTMLVVPLSAVNPRQGRFAKMGPAILTYFVYFITVTTMKSAIEDGDIPTIVGMWPVNFALLVAAITVNVIDSVPVRRMKDKFKQRKVA